MMVIVYPLPLLKGYGWAGEINLKFIFEKLFSDEGCKGYPQSRSESQKKSRDNLKIISAIAHRSIYEILAGISKEIFTYLINAGMVGVNVGIPVPIGVFPFSRSQRFFFR